MAGKSHPILNGLLILAAIFVVFLFCVGLLTFLLGGRQDLTFSDKIAVVPISGIILDAQPIVDQLYEFKRHQNVRAIILRIDSPGGGVGPAQEIYQEVKKIRSEKPVVASIGSMGASGGYYVACAADKIIANPGAIIGSIGVIVEYANVRELMEKIGLKGVVVKSGKYKDIMSPLREMTDEETTVIQDVVDDIHDQFVAAVAEGRNLDRNQVEPIADGRIFTGAKAQQFGLIDSLGTLQDAVLLTARMVGMEGEPGLIYPEVRRSLLDYLLGETSRDYRELLCIPYRFSYLLAPHSGS